MGCSHECRPQALVASSHRDNFGVNCVVILHFLKVSVMRERSVTACNSTCWLAQSDQVSKPWPTRLHHKDVAKAHTLASDKGKEVPRTCAKEVIKAFAKEVTKANPWATDKGKEVAKKRTKAFAKEVTRA